MAFILPKGFVSNSPSIRGNIEQIDAEPLDLADIAKIWKVYTTTQRRLLDPTAERLENYWWRIWGSRSRMLKGATVARLFEQISVGETFVPLRGPPNRDEGTPPNSQPRPHQRTGISASTTTLDNSNHSRPSTTTSSSTSKTQGPMPHPILKKTRGAATPGPRPTARFVSPHESADEFEEETSGSTNSHVVVVPPTPIEPPDQPSFEKKTTNSALGKKKGSFIASSRKKRPVILRRQNSQSSSDTVAKSEAAQNASAAPSSSERTPPTFSAQNPQRSKFQENFSLSPDKPKTKPPSRTNSSTRVNLKGTAPRKLSTNNTDAEFGIVSRKPRNQTPPSEPGPSKPLRPVKNSQETAYEPEGSPEEIEVQRALLKEANDHVKKNQTNRSTSSAIDEEPVPEGPAQILHKSLRSNSEMTHDFDNMHAMRLLHNHQTKSNVANVAPTLTTIRGEVELGDVGTSEADTFGSNTPRKLDKGKGRDPEEVRRANMFAKRPVQPVQAAIISEANGSLARSKSQLTLMLERDRARSGEHHKSDEDRTSHGRG